MANIQRIRCGWTGFPGAPGVNTFYALDAGPMLGDLTTFYNSLAGLLPLDVTVLVENVGDIIDPLSGDLTGTWTGEVQASLDGTAASGYAAPTGAIARWETGDVLDGHRLRGGTYLVPLDYNAFSVNGTLEDASRAGILAAGSALVAANSANFVVWHRPRAAKAADGSRPAVTARAGGYSVVTACTVPDKAVVLRSRRD